MKTDLRYEIKMVCAPQRLSQARAWIRMHPTGFGVAYPPRRVNSLYLDTPHLSSLNDNLAGLAGRQKLRLRWYGDGARVVEPLLELKQKCNLLGIKKQLLLHSELDLASSWRDILGTVKACAAPEWRVLLQTADQPTLLNHYQRVLCHA